MPVSSGRSGLVASGDVESQGVERSSWLERLLDAHGALAGKLERAVQ